MILNINDDAEAYWDFHFQLFFLCSPIFIKAGTFAKLSIKLTVLSIKRFFSYWRNVVLSFFASLEWLICSARWQYIRKDPGKRIKRNWLTQLFLKVKVSFPSHTNHFHDLHKYPLLCLPCVH